MNSQGMSRQGMSGWRMVRQGVNEWLDMEWLDMNWVVGVTQLRHDQTRNGQTSSGCMENGQIRIVQIGNGRDSVNEKSYPGNMEQNVTDLLSPNFQQTC